MKKAMILVSIGIFLFGIILPIMSNAAGKGFNLGMNFGGIPIAGTFNGYSIGGEIGFQFSERVAFTCEVGYGYQSYSYESSGEYYSYSDEVILSTVPISGSLVFITPIGEKFSARIGAGLGYYLIKINEISRESSTYYGSESREETKDINGIAPHVSFGIETAISKYASIYGEVKYSVGKAVLEEDNTYGSSKSDLLFGGPQVKIGLRFYFK
jgi:hypothetical protein